MAGLHNHNTHASRRIKALVYFSVGLNLLLLLAVSYIVYTRIWLPRQARQDALQTPPGVALKWHDIGQLNLEGKGWTQTAHRYDRLPARARQQVSPRVWELSENSAGLQVRFVTDATSIWARWVLRSRDLDAPHMAATGFSGLDLYVKEKGRWSWAGVGRPYQYPGNRTRFFHNIAPEKREYLLYLPLFNGVDSVEIGLPPEASFAPAPTTQNDVKPVVFYGTSITQGGVSSRPGMAYPAILERRLGWPAINLGFSGAGKMEPEMATLLAELKPAAYVIDCLPNMTTDEVKVRAEPLVTTLRRAHPDTPIVLVEHAVAEHSIDAPRSREIASKNAALRAAFSQMVKQRVPKLYYVPGDGLFGHDDEATVDGTHPTDLGAVRIADALEPVLKRVLGQPVAGVGK